MQTVGELVAELLKLPQEDVVDIQILHSFKFLHAPRPEEKKAE